MANNEADILLIRKYLNGELDARAMHRLEVRAQDDPFLADALDGYEKNGRDQQPALAEISSRLQQRIDEKKVKRLIPFRTLAIAASILVVFSIGWLVFNRNTTTSPIAAAIKPVEKTPAAAPLAKDTAAATQLIAKTPTTVVSKTTVVKSVSSANAVATNTASDAMADAIAAEPVIANVVEPKADTADTTPLNELVVMNYKPAKKADVSKEVSQYNSQSFKSTSPGAEDKYKLAPLEQRLNSKAAGVSNTPAGIGLASAGSDKMYIQGRIVDEIDGQPLSGVAVKAYGTSYGSITDRNGNFYIPSDSLKRGLVVSRLGYNTAKINAAKGDSLKTISLAPADIQKEPMLTNTAKNPSAVHPQIGWSKYNKYLGVSAVSPDKKTGTVQLAFSVDKNGTISNTAIITGLSDTANKKAIELINKGPKWVGNANGNTEQVTLTINF